MSRGTPSLNLRWRQTTPHTGMLGVAFCLGLIACSSNEQAGKELDGAIATDAGGSGGQTFDGGHVDPGDLDLCAGLVQDKQPRPMTAQSKPAVLQEFRDSDIPGAVIRRITSVSESVPEPVIRPMYTTVSAWNADESYLILVSIEGGTHQLRRGSGNYEKIRDLDIDPPDIEQVYWSTSDPDILFYVENKSFIRYHVAAAQKETMTTFSFCQGAASNGRDPMFTSFDSNRIGLHCDDQVFIYEISSNSVIARKTISENPAQVAPSGKLAYLSDSGRVTNDKLEVLRTLDLKEPFGHASLGRLPTGEDTWNGVVYDEGPNGNQDIGLLVTWDLAKGTSRVIIGPSTGWPYPPAAHISALAYMQPGWMFVSTYGETTVKGLLDLEMLIADTATGKVCRAGRHRSWGKDNTKLIEPYWAEPHLVPSPSGTRAVFASDWGNGSTVDAYVLELPGYRP